MKTIQITLCDMFVYVKNNRSSHCFSRFTRTASLIGICIDYSSISMASRSNGHRIAALVAAALLLMQLRLCYAAPVDRVTSHDIELVERAVAIQQRSGLQTPTVCDNGLQLDQNQLCRRVFQ